MSKFIEKIFSVKNSHDKRHKVVTIAGIQLKFRRRPTVKFNKKEMDNLLKGVDNNKINYLYLDWYFGKYVFEEMINADYQHINLIKFSLFNLFGFSTQFELFEKWEYNQTYIIKKLAKSLINKNIKALLVTYDWLPFFDSLIDMLKKIDIPTYCIIHEGVFQNEKIYYNSRKPISDKVLTWGELTRQIFIQRGYPEKDIYTVGSIKLNKYKSFTPKLTLNEFFKITNLDSTKKTILYCCQLCDNQWGDQSYALNRQQEIISDLVNISKKNNYNLIVRNAPASPSLILPPDFYKTISELQNVFIDGIDIDNSSKSFYKTNPDDSIFYSDIIIGMNTTMQLEASISNKPALVAKYFDFQDKWHKELSLPLCSNKDELEQTINKYISCNKNLIAEEAKENFYNNYGYYPQKNFNPLKNIEKILLSLLEINNEQTKTNLCCK